MFKIKAYKRKMMKLSIYEKVIQTNRKSTKVFFLILFHLIIVFFPK